MPLSLGEAVNAVLRWSNYYRVLSIESSWCWSGAALWCRRVWRGNVQFSDSLIVNLCLGDSFRSTTFSSCLLWFIYIYTIYNHFWERNWLTNSHVLAKNGFPEQKGGANIAMKAFEPQATRSLLEPRAQLECQQCLGNYSNCWTTERENV